MTSWRGITQREISFGSIIFSFNFPTKVARDHVHSIREKSPVPGA